MAGETGETGQTGVKVSCIIINNKHHHKQTAWKLHPIMTRL